MTTKVLTAKPLYPIPPRIREMMHEYLDRMLDSTEWGDGPWLEAAAGWLCNDSSGDIRLKVGREDFR